MVESKTNMGLKLCHTTYKNYDKHMSYFEKFYIMLRQLLITKFAAQISTEIVAQMTTQIVAQIMKEDEKLEVLMSQSHGLPTLECLQIELQIGQWVENVLSNWNNFFQTIHTNKQTHINFSQANSSNNLIQKISNNFTL